VVVVLVEELVVLAVEDVVDVLDIVLVPKEKGAFEAPGYP
jgi:hypothetical protein